MNNVRTRELGAMFFMGMLVGLIVAAFLIDEFGPVDHKGLAWEQLQIAQRVYKEAK